jgi:hypothetical protein
MLFLPHAKPYGNPKASTLTDNFATENTTLWTYGAGATIVSSALNLAANTSYSGYITSNIPYDLTNSSFEVGISQALGVAAAAEMWIVAQTAFTSNAYSEQVYWNDGDIMANEEVNSVSTPNGSVAFNISTMPYWRLSHSGTTLSYQYSANKTTWTTLYSATPNATINLTAVYLGIQVGYWTTPAPSPATAIFTGVND